MKTKLGQFLLIAVIGLVGVLSASAQTNLAPPSKNLLIGDWVSVVDPKDKIKFTADEFIFFKLAVDGKYTLLSNDEVEIDIGGKKGKFKATVEGDVLTIIAGNATDKYKRESSGSTVNKAQPIKNELIGTWANSSSRRDRATFTADEVTFYSFVDDLERDLGPSRGEPTDKIFKYTYVSNDEIELTSDGKISRMKIILEGEMLATINDKGVKVKYTRNLMGGATITSPLAPTDSSNPQTAPIDYQQFKAPLTLSINRLWVNSVAFSSDGKTLASGGADGTIELWIVADGKELRTLSGQSSPVNSVAFSPDGTTLASGSSGGAIRLWNVAEGKVLSTLGHSEQVRSVAFSPDGKTLASGGADGTIKLWNVADWKRLRTLSGHSGLVMSVAFSPDGKTLASGSSETKLWNVADGKELRTLSGHSGLNSVAFSPDGKTLASGSEDNTLKLWKVADGKELRTLSGHSGFVMSVAFSPDGKTLASGSSDNTIKLWKVADGKELSTLSEHTYHVFSVAFSSDGKTLASGSNDTILWRVD